MRSYLRNHTIFGQISAIGINKNINKDLRWKINVRLLSFALYFFIFSKKKCEFSFGCNKVLTSPKMTSLNKKARKKPREKINITWHTQHNIPCYPFVHISSFEKKVYSRLGNLVFLGYHIVDPEAIIPRCSVEKVFFEISQNS